MHCRNCGQEIIEGSEFCGNCGARIERHPVGQTCAQSGSLNLPEADFCSECGARLGGETVPTQSFCPECGAAVKQTAKFCKECGARLGGETVPMQSFCPECGGPLNPGAAFCRNCGRVLQQRAEYAPAAPDTGSATEYRPTYQQQAQAQPQGQDYSQQQDWVQSQEWEPAQAQQQWQASQKPQKSGQHKMLMAAAAAVVLLVIGITGFWKPGFLLDLFRSTAKLENGTLALHDISLNFKQTNLANGKATLTTVKDKEVEVHNGLIGDLYVMKIDKSCQGKVTVSVPVPKDFKPTTGNGLYIKLGVGQDYTLADGKKERYYDYFDATVKDGKAVAVIDPAALGRSVRKSKASPATSAEKKKPDLGEFTEYVGFFFKQGILMYGEGYENSKGHFRLWYNYNVSKSKNVYMGGDEAKRILSDLEEAYNYYKTHGYAEHVDTFTPIDVYITRCADEGGWNPITGNIELKESSMFGVDYNKHYEGDQRTHTRTTIYHEFFHAVQQSMIGSIANALGLLKSNWFGEATATHFERLVVPNDASENGKDHFSLLWQGVIPEGNSAADGYARGLLIDYMSSKLGGDDWIKDCYRLWLGNNTLKDFMKKIAPSEADFAAKFYMEVIRNRKLIPLYDPSSYFNKSRNPDKAAGEDRYISSIKLAMDDTAKEKVKKSEEDAFPVVFASPAFELAGYGGRVVSLITKEIINKKPVDLTESFPDKCQLKLEAEGGCRIQIIEFTGEKNSIVKGTIIKNFKEQLNKGYKYIVLVTSTQPKKQKVVLKATLEKEELKEGIYNGKATMILGEYSETINNRLGFRLSREKDGRWGLNVCLANGDNFGSAPNVPITYNAKQKIWTGHRKFKENFSSNPNKPKEDLNDINCTLRVKLEGEKPVLFVNYKIDTTKNYGSFTKESMEIRFEGKWDSELKGKIIGLGKITILE
jgi:hypothetical protein